MRHVICDMTLKLTATQLSTGFSLPSYRSGAVSSSSSSSSPSSSSSSSESDSEDEGGVNHHRSFIFICVTFLIYVRQDSFTCDIPHLYETALIHMWYDSFMCERRRRCSQSSKLFHMCDMTHVCETCLIHVSANAKGYRVAKTRRTPGCAASGGALALEPAVRHRGRTRALQICSEPFSSIFFSLFLESDISSFWNRTSML